MKKVWMESQIKKKQKKKTGSTSKRNNLTKSDIKSTDNDHEKEEHKFIWLILTT